MKVLRLMTIGGLVLTACAIAHQPVAHAQNGFPDQDLPISVDRIGAKDANGDRKGVTRVTGKVDTGGDFTMDLKNITGDPVTDVHVKVVDAKSDDENFINPKIRAIDSTAAGGSPFTVLDPDGSGGAGGAKQEASAASPSPGGGTLADDGEITVDVIVADEDGNPLPAGAEVTLEIWWTRGLNRNIEVSATSREEIGDGDPRTSLLVLKEMYMWDFDFSVVEHGFEEQVASCNELAIAECDGFRFQEGSLVLRPTNSTRFSASSLESFSISARSQDNDNVLGTGRFSAGEARIDSRGNFVIDITRKQDDDEHIVIVLSGLKVEDLSGHEAGQKVYADVSGAAVAGYCMHRYFHLLTVVE